MSFLYSQIVVSEWLFHKFLKNAGNIEMGWKSFSFSRLLILATGNTHATFQLSGSISLSLNELIIFTIGEVISWAAGFMSFAGMLPKPLEQSNLFGFKFV